MTQFLLIFLCILWWQWHQLSWHPSWPWTRLHREAELLKDCVGNCDLNCHYFTLPSWSLYALEDGRNPLMPVFTMEWLSNYKILVSASEQRQRPGLIHAPCTQTWASNLCQIFILSLQMTCWKVRRGKNKENTFPSICMLVGLSSELRYPRLSLILFICLIQLPLKSMERFPLSLMECRSSSYATINQKCRDYLLLLWAL